MQRRTKKTHLGLGNVRVDFSKLIDITKRGFGSEGHPLTAAVPDLTWGEKNPAFVYPRPQNNLWKGLNDGSICGREEKHHSHLVGKLFFGRTFIAFKFTWLSLESTFSRHISWKARRRSTKA